MISFCNYPNNRPTVKESQEMTPLFNYFKLYVQINPTISYSICYLYLNEIVSHIMFNLYVFKNKTTFHISLFYI